MENDDRLTIGTMVLTPGHYWLDNPDEVADAQERIEANQFEIAGRRALPKRPSHSSHRPSDSPSQSGRLRPRLG